MTEETAVWYIKDTALQKRIRFVGQKLYRAYYHLDPYEYCQWICLSIYQIRSDINPIRLKFKGESNAEKTMIAEAKLHEGAYVLGVKDRRTEDEFETFKFVNTDNFKNACRDFFEPYISLTPRFEKIREYYTLHTA